MAFNMSESISISFDECLWVESCCFLVDWFWVLLKSLWPTMLLVSSVLDENWLPDVPLVAFFSKLSLFTFSNFFSSLTNSTFLMMNPRRMDESSLLDCSLLLPTPESFCFESYEEYLLYSNELVEYVEFFEFFSMSELLDIFWVDLAFTLYWLFDFHFLRLFSLCHLNKANTFSKNATKQRPQWWMCNFCHFSRSLLVILWASNDQKYPSQKTLNTK